MSISQADISIANLSGGKINKVFVKKVIEKTVCFSKAKIKRLNASLIFVDKAKIKEINRVYRRKNKTTDILSFSYELVYNKKKGADIEGELMLCPEVIEKDAKKNKISFNRELAFVLSHGVLHLLGMRHSKKMFELQDEITKSIIGDS